MKHTCLVTEWYGMVQYNSPCTLADMAQYAGHPEDFEKVMLVNRTNASTQQTRRTGGLNLPVNLKALTRARHLDDGDHRSSAKCHSLTKWK